ncbi:MAG: acyltransferase family protein [Coriobacteriia bacterium]
MAPRERLAWLDVLKGAAIALVVLNHALLWPMRADNHAAAFLYGIAFGTVAAFASVAGYVQGRRPPQPARDVLPRRISQLMWPWVAWAPVYALVPVLWKAIGGGALPVGMETWPWARAVLLGGGPLWFLPVLALAAALSAHLDARGDRTWWPVWLPLLSYALTAALATMNGLSPIAVGAGTFWAVAPLYLTSHWFGVRVGRDHAFAHVRSAVLWALVVGSMVAGGACTWAREVTHQVIWSWLVYPVGAVGGLAALLLAVRATRDPGRIAQPLVRLGHVSLGVYVLHPVMIAGAMLTLPPSWGIGSSLLAWLVALPAADVAVSFVRRRWPHGVARVL